MIAVQMIERMTDSSPRISVVSIALSENELDRLETLLEQQTYDDFEFVPVVGDLSIPEAWNEGIRRAEGDIIAFTESDVEVPESWLEIIAEKFDDGEDFAMGYEVQLPQNHHSMSSTAIRADWAAETPFDEQLSVTEDTEWFARLMDKYGFRIEKSREIPIVFHYKDRSKYKWALYHGIHRAEIWLDYEYGGKSATGVTSKRLNRILTEILTLIGQGIGLLKHPIKTLRRFLG
jgi:glycosyltransferase involved in cell wall biosynthesis